MIYLPMKSHIITKIIFIPYQTETTTPYMLEEETGDQFLKLSNSFSTNSIQGLMEFFKAKWNPLLPS